MSEKDIEVVGEARLQPPVRLDQLAEPHQHSDRGLPIALHDRHRLGTLHITRVRRAQTGPCRGSERLRE